MSDATSGGHEQGSSSGSSGSSGDRSRTLRRWGPIAVIVVIALVVVGVLVASSGDDENDEAADTTSEGTADGQSATSDTPSADLVPGQDPISFTQAEAMGIVDEIDWGERCDTERGTVAMTYFYAAECYVPFTGDNGGATATGVTQDSIKIVYFLDPDDDAVLNYITGPLDYDDTNATDEATMRDFIALYETYYETYGRNVELVVVENSSTSSDAVEARAQAARIAEEIEPFMVFGSPTLAGVAFGEELAARGVPWLSLGGQNHEFANENIPYIVGIGKGASQNRLQLAEYIAKRLAGDNAVHSPDYADQPRKFAYLYIETSDASTATADFFERTLLDEYGIELADRIPYTLDPSTIQEQAATIIGRLKDQGITSVIMGTDPIAPKDFTAEATAQEYFPEWIIGSVALVDLNVFARTYDQAQWANAFGLSESAAKTVQEVGGAYALYQWFYGEPPPSDEQVGLIQPWPGVFYSVLQGVGPNLTPETFYETLLSGAPTARGGITQPSLSWGDKGIWPDELVPDLNGVDDVTEIWWKGDEIGEDENGNEGSGMYMFVDGGRHYLPGEMPSEPTRVFEPEGAIALYEEPPESEVPPVYEPLPPRP